MKTNQKKIKRYVHETKRRDSVRKILKLKMRIDQLTFNTALFDTGVGLVEQYFADAINNLHIRTLQHKILTNDEVHYWPWFLNQYSIALYRFALDYQDVYADDVTQYGKDQAATYLFGHWSDFNSEFIYSPDVEERLRNFIIQLDEKL